jgi:hypothetical protein
MIKLLHWLSSFFHASSNFCNFLVWGFFGLETGKKRSFAKRIGVGLARVKYTEEEDSVLIHVCDIIVQNIFRKNNLKSR